MKQIGYSLIDLATAAETHVASRLPTRLVVNGGVVDFDKVGQIVPDAAAPTHMLVERWAANEPPSPLHTVATETPAWDGEKIVVTYTFNNPPAPTLDDYEAAIQLVIDAEARSKKYANAVSAASYANSTVPQWAAEAAAFIAWRDQVWAYAYTQLDAVMQGQRAQPTVDELIAELPAIAWPGEV